MIVVQEPYVFPHREQPLRHRRTLLIVFLLILVLLFSARSIISYYVDSLWFSSLGYASVFWRTLSYEWMAFALSFVATFVVLYAWFSALRHGCREELASAGTVPPRQPEL